jgi:hypothetical protein
MTSTGPGIRGLPAGLLSQNGSRPASSTLSAVLEGRSFDPPKMHCNSFASQLRDTKPLPHESLPHESQQQRLHRCIMRTKGLTFRQLADVEEKILNQTDRKGSGKY